MEQIETGVTTDDDAGRWRMSRNVGRLFLRFGCDNDIESQLDDFLLLLLLSLIPNVLGFVKRREKCLKRAMIYCCGAKLARMGAGGPAKFSPRMRPLVAVEYWVQIVLRVCSAPSGYRAAYVACTGTRHLALSCICILTL